MNYCYRFGQLLCCCYFLRVSCWKLRTVNFKVKNTFTSIPGRLLRKLLKKKKKKHNKNLKQIFSFDANFPLLFFCVCVCVFSFFLRQWVWKGNSRVLCNGYSMDDKYGYVGIRDKSLRFVFFAKYNHISAQMLYFGECLECESAYVVCVYIYIYILYAQVFDRFFFSFFSRLATLSSCKFFMCYIWYNVRDFCVVERFQNRKRRAVCVCVCVHFLAWAHWLNEANFVSHVHESLAYIVSIDFSSIANWSSKTHFSIWPIKCQMDSKSVRVFWTSECGFVCECTLETVNEWLWVSEREWVFFSYCLVADRTVDRTVCSIA